LFAQNSTWIQHGHFWCTLTSIKNWKAAIKIETRLKTARLPGKAASKAAWQWCMQSMVQYAESMVKLDNNAVFWLICPQEQEQEQLQQQSKT
jgi:hypothetical protein